MGIGYWTCEDLIYDPETGSLTNYRTWVRILKLLILFTFRLYVKSK